MKQYINENLRFYRLHNRYTQQEIAIKLKATLGQVKSYETNIAVPPVDMIIRIADMIGISIDGLIRVKLSSKNYLNTKEGIPPDLLSRIDALEKKVNKTVNKSRTKSSK